MIASETENREKGEKKGKVTRDTRVVCSSLVCALTHQRAEATSKPSQNNSHMTVSCGAIR